MVPPALSWYTEPGGLPKGAQIQALVEIPEVIRYATGRLMRGQMIGGALGGVLGLVAGVLMMSQRCHIASRTRRDHVQPSTCTWCGSASSSIWNRERDRAGRGA